MTTPTNARGYAFTAFSTAWGRQLAYPAMAAAKKHGYYPILTAYIQAGLWLFDKMWVSTEHTDAELQRLVTSIIKDMGQSIRTDVLGHFKYTGGAGEPQYISTKHDVILDQPLNDETTTTIADILTSDEDGYDKIDNDDVMLQRLRLVAQRMSDTDMEILEAYIDGDTFAAACRARGVHVGAFTKRMRWQCASLKDTGVFA